MMRLSRTTRGRADSVVPMINVAFLLLVFFLMTAVLAPRDPFDITPPTASAGEAEANGDVLAISADGDLAFGALRGEAVFAALPKGGLRIRVDAGFDGTELARIVRRLAEHGATSVELVTVSGSR